MSFFKRLKRFFGGSGGPGGKMDGGNARPGSNGRGENPQPDMISCEEAIAVLYEYLDGELEDLTHERVKAHFDVCARCYPKLAMEKSFLAAVARAGAGEKAPEELRGKVLGIIDEMEGR